MLARGRAARNIWSDPRRFAQARRSSRRQGKPLLPPQVRRNPNFGTHTLPSARPIGRHAHRLCTPARRGNLIQNSVMCSRWTPAQNRAKRPDHFGNLHSYRAVADYAPMRSRCFGLGRCHARRPAVGQGRQVDRAPTTGSGRFRGHRATSPIADPIALEVSPWLIDPCEEVNEKCRSERDPSARRILPSACG